MKLSEILSVLDSADRIRIIDGKRGNTYQEMDPNVKILYSGYKSMIEYHRGETDFLLDDPEVGKLVAHPEIKHKDYEELGLLPPYEPDITRMYEFSDLTMFLYYDIYLFRKEEQGA